MDPKINNSNKFDTSLDTPKQIFEEQSIDKNLYSNNYNSEVQKTNASNSNSLINTNTQSQASLTNNNSSLNSINNNLQNLSLNKNNMIDKEKEYHNISDYNLNKNKFNNDYNFERTNEEPFSINSFQNSNNGNYSIFFI